MNKNTLSYLQFPYLMMSAKLGYGGRAYKTTNKQFHCLGKGDSYITYIGNRRKLLTARERRSIVVQQR